MLYNHLCIRSAFVMLTVSVVNVINSTALSSSVETRRLSNRPLDVRDVIGNLGT